MHILAIESSCDETAAAVVRDGVHVLSNVVSSQFDVHREYGGVVPELASRAHVERVLPVVREALAVAGVGLGWIDAIAVGNRPGLIGSLLIGVGAAKALAWSLGKPLVGVDHVHAHLYSGLLAEVGGVTPEEAEFPAVGLVVSGGHTSLYRLDSWTSLTRLGATIDDAVGEAYDKAATILGLEYPGGPNLDRLARKLGANEAAVELPVSRLGKDSLDFSFSGLKTAMLYAARGVPGRTHGVVAVPEMNEARKADLAASFQRAAVGAVMMKLERAVDVVGAGAGGRGVTVLAGGGVTANSRLREELAAFARRRGVSVRVPAPAFCMDNAAMIGGLAYRLVQAGRVDDLNLQASPTTAW